MAVIKRSLMGQIVECSCRARVLNSMSCVLWTVESLWTIGVVVQYNRADGVVTVVALVGETNTK